MPSFSRYDISRSYEWNYEQAPPPVAIDVPPYPGKWSLLGLPVSSPLGVPAGPLLNGSWCLYYASLGFDVVTYKTVRSSARKCYGMPNLQPVTSPILQGGEHSVAASTQMRGSWAVSFGMPSKAPEFWRADIERTRRLLPNDQVLAVSVVGTVQEDWSIDDLANDYALCAKWAVESGADIVETNFSCPNVTTCDGQLYHVAEEAEVVAARVREAIGSTPYLVKIGHMESTDRIDALLDALDPFVDGLAMTNSIATKVEEYGGNFLFEGHSRGICGDSIRQASLKQVDAFAKRVRDGQKRLEIVGVGGASQHEHIQAYLEAGASAVQMATSAMLDPAVAIKIRESAAVSKVTK